MRIDQVKIGVQDVRLCDDGTMDTVVVWWCEACRTWHEIRYSNESSWDYRDEETGALDLKAFVEGVVLDDINNEPAHWLEVIGERHAMYSMPCLMESDQCEACGEERPSQEDQERDEDSSEDWLGYDLEDWLSQPDRFHAWEIFAKNLDEIEPLRVTLCPRCAERMKDGTLPLFVNVYLVDMAYGGPEEGGWWYQVGSIERVYPVSCLADAAMLSKYLENGEFSNEGRRPITSVLSEGEYQVCVQLQPGHNWPSHRPHYE